MRYLLDYTILNELHDSDSAWHASVTTSVESLIHQGHVCYVDRPGLSELWSCLTRPAMLNGLGKSPDEARLILEHCLDRFPLLPDAPLPACLDVATQHAWMGNGILLAQQIVAMEQAGISHLLTLDPPDLPEEVTVQVVLLDPLEAV